MKVEISLAVLLSFLFLSPAGAADGVFVRFQLVEPPPVPWFVRLGGYIHNDPWHLPDAVWPAGGDKDPKKRIQPGQPSEWFDLAAHAGKKLHGRHKRAGGIAEFPNVTVEFVGVDTNKAVKVAIELATAPGEVSVIKRFEESFEGR